MKLSKFALCIFILTICFDCLAIPTPMDSQKKPNQQLMKDLKKGFDQIVQYHIKNGDLHSLGEYKVRSFIDYLLNQSTYTKKALKDIIQKINYETIQPDRGQIWPEMEFWRGVDDYGSVVALNYDGGVETLDNEPPIVIGRFDNYEMPNEAEMLKVSKQINAIEINLKKFPISHLGYYQYRFNESALFYAWISYLWQEVEGHKCGIKVKTIQNNSIATFSLNDYLEGDFSSFVESDIGEKPPRLSNFFPRKLSLIELYLRASQISYPYNPYKNYWRYFEKGDEFMEIVTYEFFTGIRTGKIIDKNSVTLKQKLDHKNSGDALKYLTKFTTQMIFDGWEEKFRPHGMPSKMHKEAFNFELWTGIYWGKDQTNRISANRIINFEEKLDIKLPLSFFNYLRLLNGRQHNSYSMYFPINKLYTVRPKKFYNIEELESLAKKTLPNDPQNLWIGELENGKLLGINIDQANNKFGKMVISDQGEITTCEYSFATFAEFAQNSPIQPEIYAAEKNNSTFLEQRIKDGWDVNTTYSYQTAVNQAAEKNAYDALEVLLKAGAKFRNSNYRKMTGTYDEKTMKILDKYLKVD